MRGRDPDEQHRASTPLELFFDLVIVVAIAVAGSSLHHGIAEDHFLDAVLGYILTFFAIWWAWMSFTWFATAYDTDDVPYRVAVFVQMAGAIVMAAGIGRAIDAGDWSLVLLGYIVMRFALVFQWLRAARDDPSHRTQDIRYGGRHRGDAGALDRSRSSWCRRSSSSSHSWCLSRVSLRCRCWRPGVQPVRVSCRAHRRTLRPADHHRAR